VQDGAEERVTQTITTAALGFLTKADVGKKVLLGTDGRHRSMARITAVDGHSFTVSLLWRTRVRRYLTTAPNGDATKWMAR
jgi:hypothetical protein